MNIGHKQLHPDSDTCHSFSIFYNRSNIAVLLYAINDFCEINNKYIDHWSMYFSKEQGEHINLVFILSYPLSFSPKERCIRGEEFVGLVEQYFEHFITKKSSENPISISDDSNICALYNNNSFVWNASHISRSLFENHEIRKFTQATSSLIVSLYDQNSSYDENIGSIFMFLSIKIQKRLNISLPQYADIQLAETVQSYWDFEEDSFLAEWMQCAIPASWSSIIRSHLDISEDVFIPIIGKVPTVSFCITCKNRFHQISKTLKKNLDDNRMLKRIVEFVLVDFGSTDGLHEWIIENFHDELKENYLRYYYTDEHPDWHCSIAKNTAHLLSRNEILVNLDCDNYTGFLGAQVLMELWVKYKEKGKIVVHQFSGNYTDGSYGRIAVNRDIFIKVGGYDESFEPASMQDEDLINRLIKCGLEYVGMPDSRFNCAIKNSKEETITNARSTLTYEEMLVKNKAISNYNLQAGRYTVNIGKEWGIRKNLFDWEGNRID